MNRTAVFAGSFYPNNKVQLAAMLENYFFNAKKELKEKTNQKTNCIIAPHAGYIYSAQTAAFSFSVLEKAKTFVILSPNHTGMGNEISIYPSGTWETPLGKVKINEQLSKKISELLGTETNAAAHLQEHSIEVQLPFLQCLFDKDFEIVAITIATQELQKLKELGQAIASATKKENVALIASSDFTHFEPLEEAERKDKEVIKFIEKLDIENFHKKVIGEQLSICGHSAIVALLQYAKETGKTKARLLHYDSSAGTTKDSSSVVGYASIALF